MNPACCGGKCNTCEYCKTHSCQTCPCCHDVAGKVLTEVAESGTTRSHGTLIQVVPSPLDSIETTMGWTGATEANEPVTQIVPSPLRSWTYWQG